MTTLDAPQLQQSAGTGTSGLTGWLGDNKWSLLACLAIAAIALVFYLIFKSASGSKRLQRDALEKLRMSLVESSRATRGPAKTVWLSGGPRDPPTRIGRYAGHHRALDATWIAYRTWLLGKTRILCVNPVDLDDLDASEVIVRGIALQQSRGISFALPDPNDPEQRAEWQAVTKRKLETNKELAEAAKEFFARAVDNAIAFYDSLNAAEDRSFIRQEVTRSEHERTETITVPTPHNKPDESTES